MAPLSEQGRENEAQKDGAPTEGPACTGGEGSSLDAVTFSQQWIESAAFLEAVTAIAGLEESRVNLCGAQLLHHEYRCALLELHARFADYIG